MIAKFSLVFRSIVWFTFLALMSMLIFKNVSRSVGTKFGSQISSGFFLKWKSNYVQGLWQIASQQARMKQNFWCPGTGGGLNVDTSHIEVPETVVALEGFDELDRVQDLKQNPRVTTAQSQICTCRDLASSLHDALSLQEMYRSWVFMGKNSSNRVWRLPDVVVCNAESRRSTFQSNFSRISETVVLQHSLTWGFLGSTTIRFLKKCIVVHPIATCGGYWCI